MLSCSMASVICPFNIASMPALQSLLLALSTLPLHTALHLCATTCAASMAIQGTVHTEKA